MSYICGDIDYVNVMGCHGMMQQGCDVCNVAGNPSEWLLGENNVI